MKYFTDQIVTVKHESHPTGVRGLKYVATGEADIAHASHPTGVRGLKYFDELAEESACVAPHWGAWIEILLTPL